MMVKNLQTFVFIFLVAIAGACAQQATPDTTFFSDDALNNKLISIDDSETNLKTILDQNKGKVILIEIWATWCGDCIKGIPNVKKLHKQYKDKNVAFVFLSVDRKIDAWKKGIKDYELKGQHYFIDGGWKSKLCGSLPLDWIPRYMVVDGKGDISLHKAVIATDKRITETIDGLLK